jgi:hypothetical protein
MNRNKVITEPAPWRRTNTAADRTRSPRSRAGSRRNKRLHNVPSRAGDYPASWTAFYHCDGTFSHAEPNPRQS